MKFTIDYLTSDGYIAQMPMDPKYSSRKAILDSGSTMIKARTITFEYDYPLRDYIQFTHTSKNGWTRRKIFDTIQKDYLKIYKEEDEAIADGEEGPHGIWGHDLGDLFLEGVFYNSKTKMVTIDVGS
jgi:hypothetical protein